LRLLPVFSFRAGDLRETTSGDGENALWQNDKSPLNSIEQLYGWSG
jgi:hypothetical protein